MLVALMAGKAEVKYHADLLDAVAVTQLIEELGFGASLLEDDAVTQGRLDLTVRPAGSSRVVRLFQPSVDLRCLLGEWVTMNNHVVHHCVAITTDNEWDNPCAGDGDDVCVVRAQHRVQTHEDQRGPGGLRRPGDQQG